MDARELRIGNLITEYDNVLIQVSCWEFEKARLNNNEDEMPWMQPIPLTEEWLLKFGFLEDEKYDNTYCKYLSVLNGFTTMEYDLDNNLLLLDNMEIKIKHVHQLQNLYFALTGKELEITKTK